jgi:dolichol-phosphate hexosyltransferase
LREIYSWGVVQLRKAHVVEAVWCMDLAQLSKIEFLETIDMLNYCNIAIVIPTLDEAESIGSLLDEVARIFVNCKVDVVVVDGHSLDGTDVIAKEKRAHVIYQSDKGYGNALKLGFDYVLKNFNAEIIIMMDADSTYDVGEISLLIEPIIRNEADLVLGNRFAHLNNSTMKFKNRLGNRLISWFARQSLRIKVNDTQSGFRAIRSDLAEKLNLEAEGMPFAVEMLVEAKSAGAKICEVPINYRSRIGVTKLDPLKDGFSIVVTIVRLMRDTQPLAFFGVISIILGIIGLIFGIEVSYEWVMAGTISRLPTVMLSVLLLVGAIQFFTIGLVADMLKNIRRSFRSR